MSPFSRREFLERSAILSAAAAAVGVSPGQAHAQSAPVKAQGAAADRVRIAVVGVNSRGMSLVNGFAGKNNCEVVTVCDCDEGVIGKAMDAIKKAQGTPPTFVKDFRKLLDDKSIDAIGIATPDHWHALMAVWAMRAGKDVYLEKPASHNLREGRLIIDAAKKYGRICQVGTQSRSNPGMRQAIQYIHDGKIGKVDLAYGTCFKPRPSIGDIGRTQGDQTPPKTMDYDLWCGPAPFALPRRKNVHYDWHWVWEYGNGDFANQGAHEVDKARWGLNKPGLPASVVTVGGRFGYVDDGETPNTELALYDYGDAHLIFEVRGLPTKPFKGSMVGNVWFGSEGYVVCPDYISGTAFDKNGKVTANFSGGGDQHHFDNFLKAVRTRKTSDMNCPIEEGHLSAALCHLANISYRLGAEATMDKADAAFGDAKDGKEAVTRMKDHLKDNKVEGAVAVGRIGPKLTIDPKTEKFTSAGGADLTKANAMLYRAQYRKGFDLNEAV